MIYCKEYCTVQNGRLYSRHRTRMYVPTGYRSPLDLIALVVSGLNCTYESNKAIKFKLIHLNKYSESCFTYI
jgi:hypothetical protein